MGQLAFSKGPPEGCVGGGGRAEAGDGEFRGCCRIQAKDELLSGTGNREKRMDPEVVTCHWVVGMCFCQKSLLSLVFGLNRTLDIAQILFCFCFCFKLA